MKRIDDVKSETFWKVCVAGASGTGKTTLGVSAPKPLILLSERQGLPSVKAAALRLGKPVPPALYMEVFDDYRHVLKALHGDRSAPFVVVDSLGEVVLELAEWPETVVVDSLTDAGAVLVKEIRAQAPQRTGKDGLPADADRFWGVLMDRQINMIKAFRDLPMHVLFLCLRDERVKEDRDGNVLERVVQPKLSPRSQVPDLCAAVNLVGYSYRTYDKKLKRIVHGVVFECGEEAVTKICEPLRAVEVADMASWIARLNGHLDSVPAAPAAPGELSVAELSLGDGLAPGPAPAAPAEPGPAPAAEPPLERQAAEPPAGSAPAPAPASAPASAPAGRRFRRAQVAS